MDSDIQEKIDYILDEFDFETVSKIMNLLDWKWYNSEGNFYIVPKISDMRKIARKLLKDSAKGVLEGNDEFRIGSGGFEAYAYLDENKIVRFNLSFIATELET